MNVKIREQAAYKKIYKEAIKIAAFIKNFIINLLWLVSEIEALFSKPNDPLLFRKTYLRLMGVKVGKKFWVGKSLNLFNGGDLVIGERCALGSFVRIENWSRIKIGDDFVATPGLHLNSGDHAL